MGWTYASLSHPLPFHLRVNDDSQLNLPSEVAVFFETKRHFIPTPTLIFFTFQHLDVFLFFCWVFDCCKNVIFWGLGGKQLEFLGKHILWIEITEIFDEFVFSDKIWHTPYTTKNQQKIGPKMGRFLLMFLLLNSFCWYFQIQNLIPPGKDRWRSPLPLVLGNIMAPKIKSPRNFGVASSYPSTFNAGVVFGGCTL